MSDLVIRPSIKGVISWYALSAILAIAVLIYLQSREFKPSSLWALLAVPAAIDMWSAMKHVRLNSRRLTISEGVLRLQDGVVGKSQRNIVLNKVRDVCVDQSIGQRMMGVGNLSVEAIGDSGSFTIENVDQPHQASAAILAAVRAATS